MSEPKGHPKYSVIVLLEEGNDAFAEFIGDLDTAFGGMGESFEIVIMANGMEGFVREELTKLPPSCNGRVRVFALNRKSTQAVCLRAGFKESRGEIIVVCGEYQQIALQSFTALLNAFDKGVDIISPWRQNRVDPGFNQFQSKVFNWLARKVIGTDLHDLSCTVKIVRREVLEETELYGNMYRFLPVIAAQKGFRGRELKCDHYRERGKTGFYNASEYLSRIVDIFTVFFTTRFGRKPLRFFALLGSGFLVSGVLIMAGVFFSKVMFGNPIGGRFELLLSVILMLLGVQAASIGLLGEVVAFIHGRNRPSYTISTII